MISSIFKVFGHLWAIVTIPLVLILIVFPIAVLSIPLNVKWRVKIVGPFWKFFCLYILKFACWCKIHSEDHRSPEYKKYPYHGLYIGNHQSYMDIPVLLSQYQVPPIMKKEVLYIPIIGILAWASGALVVSRGKRDSRKKVFVQARDRLVKEKYCVQYYPEGTRSKTGTPKEYKDIKVTLIHLAFEGNIPVIPFSIYGTNKVLTPKGLVNFGTQVAIKTQNALLPKDYPDANQFARACWEKIIQGHRELREQLGN
jgi:1-acyl-sn-glycerol-3-phosphate acyltransferase